MAQSASPQGAFQQLRSRGLSPTIMVGRPQADLHFNHRLAPSMAFSLSQTDVALHRSGRAGQVLAAIENWLERERERVGIWLPVMLGVGIGAWFALPDERAWAAWVALCCIFALFALALPRGGRLPLVVSGSALLAASGCILIWVKALGVGEPPLTRPVFSHIEGRIVSVEPQPARQRIRLVVEPLRQRSDLPRRIRVNVGIGDIPRDAGKGAFIAFRARLMPPAGPAVPGAYDFAARAYFSGIGATGRALPPIEVLGPAASTSADARQRLVAHVNRQLGGGEGAIAATLATGDRGLISDADAEAMRRSGLAHLLSISGLHVSALIGTVIFLVYRLLALSPRLALTLPLMLIAAGAGAAAGIGYTLFTGAEVPTVRSCTAALLVLGGLALGRDAISLRLVATGALVVLLLWPETLTGPSFQMSFAAVTVIVALAESRWFRALTHARAEARWKKAGRAVAALFLVGLAVEAALTPIAMFHFHKAGMLGAFANLIAIPLTTFVIMPVEALALALDVAGLGAPLWWVVGKALGLLLALAHAVAAHPLAVWSLPAFPGGVLAVMTLGALWFIIWRTAARWLGLAMALGGAIWMALTPVPDILVTGDGRHMAVRQDDGRLALLRGRAGDYVRDTLADSAGEGDAQNADASLALLATARNVRCSRDLCSVLVRKAERDWLIVATRSKLYVPWRDLIELCARADIMISERRLPAACNPRWLKLDRARLGMTGGVAIYLDSTEWTGAIPAGDAHPWITRRR